MHFQNCLYPKRIRNPYTLQWLDSPCGECDVCLNRRSLQFRQRIEYECTKHKFNVFFTLTYAEPDVPLVRYDRSSLQLSSVNRTKVSMSKTFEDDDVYSALSGYKMAKEESFWFRKSNYLLRVVSKYDVQKFLMNLRNLYKRKYGITENAFRFFIASEYGPGTFRPHYHGIFFFDDRRIAESMFQDIDACWPFGSVDAQWPKNSSQCGNYVAKYVCGYSKLPQVLKVANLCPFVLYSRRPSIGYFEVGGPEHKEIVARTISFINRGSTISSSDVDYFSSLPPYIKSSLFPKCREFERLSKDGYISLRERYAACTITEYTECERVKVIEIAKFDTGWKVLNEYAEDRLYRDRYISLRVRELAKSVGVVPSKYVLIIKAFYEALLQINEKRWCAFRQYYFQEHPEDWCKQILLDADLCIEVSKIGTYQSFEVGETKFFELVSRFEGYGLDLYNFLTDFCRFDVGRFNLFFDDGGVMADTNFQRELAAKIARDSCKTKTINEQMNVLNPSFDLDEYRRKKNLAKYR